MEEVKMPAREIWMNRSKAGKAIQECLNMVHDLEKIDFHFYMGYRECLNDFCLAGEDAMDFEKLDDTFPVDKDLLIQNQAKYINKSRWKDADANGYLQCLFDLGLLGEADEQ